MAKTEDLHILVEPEMKRVIAEHATRDRRTLSDWVRLVIEDALMDHAERLVDTPAEYDPGPEEGWQRFLKGARE